VTVVHYANTDLVAAGFIKAILNRTSGVGADLPGDNSWITDGFVQITAGIGGSSSVNVPRVSPVVSVKCWWRNAGNSRRPPWNKSNSLAESIRAGCFRAYQSPVEVVLPGDYPTANVRSAYLLTEPRRIPGDDSAFACHQFDMQLHWTAVPS
jgi:hypothetical protein